MSDLISQLDLNSGDLVALTAIVLGIVFGCLVAIISVVAAQWRKVRQTQLKAGLTQDMLDRGLGAEEIERVLTATSQEDIPWYAQHARQAARSARRQ